MAVTITEGLGVRPTVHPEVLGKGEGTPTWPEALTSLSKRGLRSEDGFDGSRRLVSLLPSGLMSRGFQLNIPKWETQGSAAS